MSSANKMFGVIEPPYICSNTCFPCWPIQDWKLEKKSSDIFIPNNSGSASDIDVDEETPLTQSTRLSHIGRSQVGNHGAWFMNSRVDWCLEKENLEMEYADSFCTLDPYYFQGRDFNADTQRQYCITFSIRRWMHDLPVEICRW